MRHDLQPLRARDETSTGLRILTAWRADKSADREGAINRLHAQLLEYFPALERAFDYSRSKAALLLLTNTGPRTESAEPAKPGSKPG